MKELLNETEGKNISQGLMSKPEYLKFKKQNNIEHNHPKMMELLN